MANLTTKLGFASEHFDFAVSQNQGAEEELWNRLGLEGGLGASVSITLPEFGPPFLDLIATIRTTLGLESQMNPFVSLRSAITPFIEKLGRFASSRIDRSTRE